MFAHIEPILSALATFAKGYATGAAITSGVLVVAAATVLGLAALKATATGAWLATGVVVVLFLVACVPLFVWGALTLPGFLAAAALVDRQRFATSVVQTVEAEFVGGAEPGQPLSVSREDVAKFRGGFDQLAQNVAAKAPWGARAIAAWVMRRVIGLIGDAAANAVLAEFKADGSCTVPGSIAQYCGRFIDRLIASTLRATYWRGTLVAAGLFLVASAALLFVPTTVSSR